ncbi:MAG TPA: serine/threonine-protein kinase [Polyangiaceae bacterium]|nr:serine/threonine-protein kinase [Polyangiaceae bacterium]
MPHEGEIIAGKFKVERVLGQGGMGVVLAARHIELRQPVAIKFLLPQALQLPDASARFLREARAAAAIESEHVARVLDVGTLETGAPYMVMEYLTGRNLKEVLQAHAHLPVEEAVDYVIQVCRALGVAHSLGIVHRDLKPANLFLAERADGSKVVKVLDFGLSKVTAGGDGVPVEQGLTATHVVVGTPHYMPPEQLRSLKYVDARGDLWALGVILYELITGQKPFDGSSMPEVFAMIIAGVPPPIRPIQPDVTRELEELILRCLEKDPSRRIQTVQELSASLEPFGFQHVRASMRVSETAAAGERNHRSSGVGATSGSAGSTTMNVATSMLITAPDARRKKRLLLGAAGAGALIAAAVAVVGLTRTGNADLLLNAQGISLLQAAAEASSFSAPPPEESEVIRPEPSATPKMPKEVASPAIHAKIEPSAAAANGSPSQGARSSAAASSPKTPATRGTTTKKASTPAANDDVRDRWE